MSLSAGLGMGSRRAGATMLPGAGIRSRSAGVAPFLACAGGLVSTSAGSRSKCRQSSGPPEKISKESYALALEEQIASRKLYQPVEGDAAPMPWSSPDEARPVQERVMGVRHGGPMAPAPKETYASALRAQIQARDAQRAIDQSSRPLSAGPDTLTAQIGQRGVEAPALGDRGRRRPPAMPSKESYALELQEQIAQRSVHQAELASLDVSPGAADEDALDDLLAGKGRRHGGPLVLPPKDMYAAELHEQIAAREARRAADKANDFTAPGIEKGFSEQRDRARGRRHEVQIDQASKSSYQSALQGQMAERASERAANAFHLQPRENTVVVVESPKAGRRKCAVTSMSKHAYAEALQEQIAERRAQEDVKIAPASFIGGVSSDADPVRGRRHVGQMPHLSKEHLKLDLQRQMAEREAQRAETRFHVQAPLRPPISAQSEGFWEPCDADMHSDSLQRLLGANAG